MQETDGFTYAVDEDGDLLWFVSPGVCYAGGSAKPRPAQPQGESDS